jgi:hypothetical protein
VADVLRGVWPEHRREAAEIALAKLAEEERRKDLRRQLDELSIDELERLLRAPNR